MKYLLMMLSILLVKITIAQTDTLPPYAQVPYVPPFKIQLADSSWMTKDNLSSKKPTLILYFSPDCGHCQIETEDIIANIHKLRNLQIVMITSKGYDDMRNFSNYFKLNRFHNIKVGSDTKRFITNFYSVKTTPFSAVYDKKGKLVKAYEKGINFEELARLAK